MLKNIFSTSILIFCFTTIALAQRDKSYLQSYDMKLLQEERRAVEKELSIQKNFALQYAEKWGIPISYTDDKGVYHELLRVDTPNNVPIYYATYNRVAAISTRTNYLQNGGGLSLNLAGQDMTVHIWDAGLARTTHQEYQSASGSRYSIGDTTTAIHSHASHVTGTVMSQGIDTNARGMAPACNVVGYKWDSDIAEAYTAAAAGMLISNHSYGYSPTSIPANYFGAYDGTARSWDRLAYLAPYYLMVGAAGNSGSTSPNDTPFDSTNPTYDKFTGFACGKNNLIVANAQDASINPTTGELVSVTINSTSSQGPTDDLRIKPDITGNGTTLYSTLGSTNTAYGNNSGTSMASPNVAGSLILLQEHYYNLNNIYLKASSLKGIVLHTADDAGIAGPDARYGWGLLNAKKAATLITDNNNTSLINELSLNNGQTYSRTLTSDGINPLVVSISWTDPRGLVNINLNDTTSRLVNDLDLRIIKGDTTYYPWRLTGAVSNAKGDNNKDPYEQVVVPLPSGDYIIQISHKGTLTDGLQNFSLIASGINYTYSCNPTVPSGIVQNSVTDNSFNVSWNPIIDATYQVIYKATTATTWDTINTTANNIFITGLAASTEYQVRVRAVCGAITSDWSSELLITTLVQQYCESQGTNTMDEYINRIVLNTIDNTSGPSPEGYQDFTSLNTNLTKGNTYTLSVYPIWPSTAYNDGVNVYIDYNNDKIFDPNTELIFSNPPSTNTLISGTFTVPASAVESTTRLRVSLKYNGNAGPCEIFDYGEVEDYNVTILSNPLSIITSDLVAYKEDKNNLIKWKVEPKEEVSKVSLEYSVDGIIFNTIAEYDASQIQENNTYRHNPQSSSHNYYRLSIIDKEMDHHYSKVIYINNDNKNEYIKLYPNPVTSEINVLLNAKKIDIEKSSMKIIDVNGKVLQHINKCMSSMKIDVSYLVPGIYYLKVNNDENLIVPFVKE